MEAPAPACPPRGSRRRAPRPSCPPRGAASSARKYGQLNPASAAQRQTLPAWKDASTNSGRLSCTVGAGAQSFAGALAPNTADCGTKSLLPRALRAPMCLPTRPARLYNVLNFQACRHEVSATGRRTKPSFAFGSRFALPGGKADVIWPYENVVRLVKGVRGAARDGRCVYARRHQRVPGTILAAGAGAGSAVGLVAALTPYGRWRVAHPSAVLAWVGFRWSGDARVYNAAHRCDPERENNQEGL